METKFILKSTGEPVKIGDFITKKTINTFSNGNSIVTSTFVLTEKAFDKLLKKGVIVKDTKNTNNTETKDIKYYMYKVGKKLGYNEQESIKFFNILKTFNIGAAIKLISKEIAIDLDKKYTDHISNAKHLFCISLFDATIIEISPDIKNYNVIALFRNKEDAEFAVSILKNL